MQTSRPLLPVPLLWLAMLPLGGCYTLGSDEGARIVASHDDRTHADPAIRQGVVLP
jgi:hypothetical protein